MNYNLHIIKYTHFEWLVDEFCQLYTPCNPSQSPQPILVLSNHYILDFVFSGVPYTWNHTICTVYFVPGFFSFGIIILIFMHVVVLSVVGFFLKKNILKTFLRCNWSTLNDTHLKDTIHSVLTYIHTCENFTTVKITNVSIIVIYSTLHLHTQTSSGLISVTAY